MNLLNERANIFLTEAKEENLEILPYKSGFFVTVPIGEFVDKVIEDLEVEIQNSSSTYESTKLKYKFLKSNSCFSRLKNILSYYVLKSYF